MSLVRVLCLSLLLLAAPPWLVAATDNPDSLRVLHRIYHPSRPSEPFTDRGALILTRSGPAVATPHTKGAFNTAVRGANLLPHETLPQDLVGLEHAFQSIVDDLVTKGLSATKASQEVLYQLALEHPGDSHHSQWHVSSVKACHLAQSTFEDVTIHFSANISLLPFALDYFVGPIPHDGSCPRLPKRQVKTGGLLHSDETVPETPLVSFAGLARLNSTVHVKAPRVPPLPTLKTPPPVNAEGKVVQPPPEKSFLQKYWIYIAVAMAALGAPLFSRSPVLCV
ncbi:hypothetical protein BDY19DRAFT_990348 [Irpex rosettiformis]|uniref:Uncharacterized protein n=1 Tax=Irpex rosettiformis TaxID=378272 RepID=A0ACB8UEF7_9APHY|nr:hypothetical protein BDY19DRAFT_990348 [Irpex rosettiformis]